MLPLVLKHVHQYVQQIYPVVFYDAHEQLKDCQKVDP